MALEGWLFIPTTALPILGLILIFALVERMKRECITNKNDP